MRNNFSRRHFARLLGTGAAAAAFPSVLSARTLSRPTVLLNSNENSWGPSPAAIRAIRDSMDELFRYPDEAEVALAGAIAKLHGLSTSEVLLGNGSSDILRLAAAGLVGPGRRLVTADPTFESLGNHSAGFEVVKVPLDASYAHDLDAMLEASKNAGLVYICNPNNPTATITPKAKVRAFLDAVPQTTAVMVDEAYHHYVTSTDYESLAPLVKTKPNLIVVRTFSKVYAMAGLRCGYALGQKAILDRLNRHQAFNVMNIAALVAARASLLDEDHVTVSRKRNRDTRASVVAELDRLGYRTLPSEANFMMIDMRREVRPLLPAFRENGVWVARLFPSLPQHMRVTIGRPAEMQRFLEAFRLVV